MQMTKTVRIHAIDWLRALTMLLMLFVNDIPGVKDIPHWLHHAKYDEDMLGFSDLIFPCFLFCVGLSIPFAVNNRLSKGDSRWEVFTHALWRTIALVTLGIFTMNLEESGSLMQATAMVAGAFLLLNQYPTGGKWKTIALVLRIAGVAVLVGLVLWRDGQGIPTERGWYGILGLIGWSYGVCMLLYLMWSKLWKVMTVWVVVMILAILNHSAFIPWEYASRALLLSFVPSDWTLHAFSFTGVALSVILQKLSTEGKTIQLVRGMLVAAVVSVCLGVGAHHFWIISKVQATPTWYFFCMALFLPLLALFIYLFDIRDRVKVRGLLRPAATATLTCYLIPYFWYPVRGMIDVYLPDCFYAGILGLLNSLVYALIILAVVGVFGRIGIKLKL